MRDRSLSTWLGVALLLAIALPACGAAAMWVGIDAYQQADLDSRVARAADAIEATPLGILDRTLARKLAALDVEAELGTSPVKPMVGEVAARDAKLAVLAREKRAGAMVKRVPARTAGMEALLTQDPDGKRLLQEKFVERSVPGAQLFLSRPAASVRVAGAGSPLCCCSCSCSSWGGRFCGAGSSARWRGCRATSSRSRAGTSPSRR